MFNLPYCTFWNIKNARLTKIWKLHQSRERFNFSGFRGKSTLYSLKDLRKIAGLKRTDHVSEFLGIYILGQWWLWLSAFSKHNLAQQTRFQSTFLQSKPIHLKYLIEFGLNCYDGSWDTLPIIEWPHSQWFWEWNGSQAKSGSVNKSASQCRQYYLRFVSGFII